VTESLSRGGNVLAKGVHSGWLVSVMDISAPQIMPKK
jgi:hypothetical protein